MAIHWKNELPETTSGVSAFSYSAKLSFHNITFLDETVVIESISSIVLPLSMMVRFKLWIGIDMPDSLVQCLTLSMPYMVSVVALIKNVPDILHEKRRDMYHIVDIHPIFQRTKGICLQMNIVLELPSTTAIPLQPGPDLPSVQQKLLFIDTSFLSGLMQFSFHILTTWYMKPIWWHNSAMH